MNMRKLFLLVAALGGAATAQAQTLQGLSAASASVIPQILSDAAAANQPHAALTALAGTSGTPLGTTPATIFAPPASGVFNHLAISVPLSAPAGTRINCTFDGSTPNVSTPPAGSTVQGIGGGWALPDALGVSNTPGQGAKCVSSTSGVVFVNTPTLPFGAN